MPNKIPGANSRPASQFESRALRATRSGSRGPRASSRRGGCRLVLSLVGFGRGAVKDTRQAIAGLAPGTGQRHRLRDGSAARSGRQHVLGGRRGWAGTGWRGLEGRCRERLARRWSEPPPRSADSGGAGSGRVCVPAGAAAGRRSFSLVCLFEVPLSPGQPMAIGSLADRDGVAGGCEPTAAG